MQPRSNTPGTSFRLLVVGLLICQPMTPTVIVVDGTCTLEDAILAANTDTPQGGCPAGTAADEIQLTADVSLLTALPALAGDVVVEGNGFAVSRDNAAPEFSVLELTSNQPIELRDVTLSNGQADFGGGLLNQALGPVILTNTTVSGNAANDSGGGIFSGPDADLTLVDSVVIENYAVREGGGVASEDGLMTIVRSSVLDNQAGLSGGGVYADFTYGSIVDSTISDNVSGFSGGGVGTWDSTISIFGSTLSGNSAAISGGGARLYGNFYSNMIANSTITGNEAGTRGGGVFAGGYYFSLDLQTTTITGNMAPNAGGLHFYTSDVGPDQNGIDGFLTFGDSIIAGNTAENCTFSFSNPTNEGGNFDDDGTCDGALPITPGVDFETTAADNGGPTLTHALLPGSVAIDAGGACDATIDQRGFPRDDGACDSGAYEFDGFTIAISGQCPGDIVIDVSTPEPNQRIAMFAGPSTGSSTLAGGPCAGTDLDIDMPRLWRTARTDGTGQQQIDLNLSANWCGRAIQAINPMCEASNAIVVP